MIFGLMRAIRNIARLLNAINEKMDVLIERHQYMEA